MTDKWFSIKTGNKNFTCFTNNDIKNFGFEEWKKQAPKCAGGKSNGKCSLSCQDCSQQSVSCCSGQYCPSLSNKRDYYNLGPLKSIKVGGNITEQPYTFPLPLDYGPWPPLNTNLLTWARVP